MRKIKNYLLDAKKFFIQKPVLDDFINSSISHMEHLFKIHPELNKSTNAEVALSTTIVQMRFLIFKSLLFSLVASVFVIWGLRIIGILGIGIFESGISIFEEQSIFKYIIFSIIVITLGLLSLKVFIKTILFSGYIIEIRKQFSFLFMDNKIESLEMSQIEKILKSKFLLLLPEKYSDECNLIIEKFNENIIDSNSFTICYFIIKEYYMNPQKLNMIMRFGAILYNMDKFKFSEDISSNPERSMMWCKIIGLDEKASSENLFTDLFTTSWGYELNTHKEKYREIIKKFSTYGFYEGVEFLNNELEKTKRLS